MEIGYLKLFVSTEYINLSGIEQESPMTCAPRMSGMEQREPPRLSQNIVYGTTVHFIVRSKQHNGKLHAHKPSVPISREPGMDRTHQLVSHDLVNRDPYVMFITNIVSPAEQSSRRFTQEHGKYDCEPEWF